MPSSTKAKASSEAATDSKSDSVDKVRVWWPPTKDKKRSDFGGAYWPAKVLSRSGGNVEVQYDNGEKEKVDKDNVSPLELPVDFGEEETDLEIGEFCEVFNGSKTDPGAWLGRVAQVSSKGYKVEYPFHDAKPETVAPSKIRRARVWEGKKWLLLKPGQKWEDGDVTHPYELEMLSDKELESLLKEGAKASVSKAAEPKASKSEVKAKPSSSKQEQKAAKPASSKQEAKKVAQQKENGSSSKDSSSKKRKAEQPEEQQASKAAKQQDKDKDKASSAEAQPAAAEPADPAAVAAAAAAAGAASTAASLGFPFSLPFLSLPLSPVQGDKKKRKKKEQEVHAEAKKEEQAAAAEQQQEEEEEMEEAAPSTEQMAVLQSQLQQVQTIMAEQQQQEEQQQARKEAEEAGVPKKHSAFALFMLEHKKTLPEAFQKYQPKVQEEASKAWLEMSDDQKDVYRQRSQQEQQEYDSKVAELQAKKRKSVGAAAPALPTPAELKRWLKRYETAYEVVVGAEQGGAAAAAAAAGAAAGAAAAPAGSHASGAAKKSNGKAAAK